MINKITKSVSTASYGDVTVEFFNSDHCKNQITEVKFDFDDWRDVRVKTLSHREEEFCTHPLEFGDYLESLTISVEGSACWEMGAFSKMLRAAADSIDEIIKSGASEGCD